MLIINCYISSTITVYWRNYIISELQTLNFLLERDVLTSLWRIKCHGFCKLPVKKLSKFHQNTSRTFTSWFHNSQEFCSKFTQISSRLFRNLSKIANKIYIYIFNSFDTFKKFPAIFTQFSQNFSKIFQKLHHGISEMFLKLHRILNEWCEQLRTSWISPLYTVREQQWNKGEMTKKWCKASTTE